MRDEEKLVPDVRPLLLEHLLGSLLRKVFLHEGQELVLLLCAQPLFTVVHDLRMQQ